MLEWNIQCIVLQFLCLFRHFICHTISILAFTLFLLVKVSFVLRLYRFVVFYWWFCNFASPRCTLLCWMIPKSFFFYHSVFVTTNRICYMSCLVLTVPGYSLCTGEMSSYLPAQSIDLICRCLHILLSKSWCMQAGLKCLLLPRIRKWKLFVFEWHRMVWLECQFSMLLVMEYMEYAIVYLKY